MEIIFVISILFFASVVITLHIAALKMDDNDVSRKEKNSARFYHWNWLLLIGGICTALFIGLLKWIGIIGLV